MFMHFPMHTFSTFKYTCYLNYLGAFLIVFFFTLSILYTLVVFVAPKRKSTPTWNLLHSGASSFSNHVPLSLSVSVMMMPTRHLWKKFPNEAFIRNAESFWVILLTPTFPLSFIVGNGSLFVTSSSLVLLYWFRSSTKTCTGLTILYLILLLVSEVFLFLSHHSLLRMCLGFLG